MPGNEKQTIDTPYGTFEIGPMQISELYRSKLNIILELCYEIHKADKTHPLPFEELAPYIVLVWDRLRQ